MAPKKEKKAAEPKAEEKPAEEKPVEEKKRKAEEAPAEEPPAKKEDTEQEQDDVEDKRSALKSPIGFCTPDTTLNVVSTTGGKVLMSLNEGGMQYLIGGARANVGMKAGRYMYEAKIIEAFNPTESSQVQKGKLQGGRQVFRIGFSVAGSSLILGDADDCIFFDSDGQLGAGKMRQRLPGLQKFSRDMTMAVLLNLDSSSANANTISLFREGVRMTKPFKLPENLIGKTLVPHISFRSVSVYVNFGPTPARPLPFQCRMIQSAAEKDTGAATAKPPKDGKYELVLPVGFPDEGTFEWLDEFLEKNPSYMELSDRKLKDWAASSGLGRHSGGSKDKPAFNYGIPSMDNFSLQKVVSQVAPLSARNYVIMEVKSNLVKHDRSATLKRFSSHRFKKLALVVMGEPKGDFKKKTHAKLLKAKQVKVTAEWQNKKRVQKQQIEKKKQLKILAEKKKEAEERRKKLLEEAAKKKAEAEAKKKAEAEAKKAAEEAKKAAEEKKDDDKKEEKKDGEKKEEKAAEEKKDDEKKEEKKEEDNKEEEKKEEETKKDDQPETNEEMKDAEKKDEKKEEEKKEEPEDEPMEDLGEEPPVAELDEEEQKQCFVPKIGTGDLMPQVLSSAFAQFTLPSKEEGFDEIKYEWQAESSATEYLRKWVLEKKSTTRIDSLTPSQYFKDKLAAFNKQKGEWEAKLQKFKSAGKKKTNTEQAAVDIFAVEDVNDTGGGEPLYANFEAHDWVLLQLRYELHLLIDAFKHDVDDPDRETIPEPHFPFYYAKYYNKQMSPKMFTLDSIPALVKLVKDTVVIDGEKKVLASALTDDVKSLDIFVKLGEESRRERQRRLDAGDETARLKYVPPPVPQKPKPAEAKPAAPKQAAPKPAAAKPAAPKPAAAKPAAAKPAAAKPTIAKPAAAKPAAAKPAAAKPAAAKPVSPVAPKAGVSAPGKIAVPAIPGQISAGKTGPAPGAKGKEKGGKSADKGGEKKLPWQAAAPQQGAAKGGGKAWQDNSQSAAKGGQSWQGNNQGAAKGSQGGQSWQGNNQGAAKGGQSGQNWNANAGQASPWGPPANSKGSKGDSKGSPWGPPANSKGSKGDSKGSPWGPAPSSKGDNKGSPWGPPPNSKGDSKGKKGDSKGSQGAWGAGGKGGKSWGW